MPDWIYSLYEIKKNNYYNKCCKSGLDPSAEICLTEQEETELIKNYMMKNKLKIL